MNDEVITLMMMKMNFNLFIKLMFIIDLLNSEYYLKVGDVLINGFDGYNTVDFETLA